MSDAAKVERWGHRLSELLDEMRRSEIGEYSQFLVVAIADGELMRAALKCAADEIEEAHAS